MLHVRCGDDILDKLRRAGVPGAPLCWIDPLCEGPTPDGVTIEGFRAVRANWMSGRYGLNETTLRQRLAAQDQALETAAAEADEVVLWFDHHLFDQIVLIYLLDRLWLLAAGRISLISIDRHPEIRRFVGLGPLEPAQLAALFPKRRRITQRHIDLATQAWRAFSAETPEPLNRLLEDLITPGAALPFLGRALDRYRRHYPWRCHGVSLTEWRVLAAIDRGAIDPAGVVAFLHAREAAPWQANAMIQACLRDVSTGDEPLVVAGAGLTLTTMGRAVLERRFRARPRERWLGGVRLGDGLPVWCWDDAIKRLILLKSE